MKKKNKPERQPLKAWGNVKGTSESEEGIAPIQLEEICLLADPKMLRKIAKHLKKTAKILDKWDHHHMGNHKHGVEVVILSPKHMAEYEAERQHREQSKIG